VSPQSLPSLILGAGFGTSQATACRHKDEGIEALAREAPDLREALEKAADRELPYVILDGTLISSDRCLDKKTSRKGTETGKWYSGKAHEHVGLVQGIMSPDGIPLWSRTPAPAAPTTSPPPASWSCPACGPG
jgi:hypothetical protein